MGFHLPQQVCTDGIDRLERNRRREGVRPLTTKSKRFGRFIGAITIGLLVLLGFVAVAVGHVELISKANRLGAIYFTRRPTPTSLTNSQINPAPTAYRVEVTVAGSRSAETLRKT